MGEGRRQRERFFAEHPACCFCGGTAAASTLDHIPPRAAFVGRIGPEGFEFPACEDCNAGTSDSEQVFAFYARLMDRNDANYDQRQLLKLIAGVRNNFPNLLPLANLPALRRRKILRHWGWKLPRGAFLADTGLISIPRAAEYHIERIIAKLLAALHYRHVGRPLTSRDAIFTTWSQQGLPGTDEALDILAQVMPGLVVGRRVNTSIGDQFAYRWGMNEADRLFGFTAGFGGGMLLIAGAGSIEIATNHKEWSPYIPPIQMRPTI